MSQHAIDRDCTFCGLHADGREVRAPHASLLEDGVADVVAEQLLQCTERPLHVDAVLLVLVEVRMVGEDVVTFQCASGGAEHHRVPVVSDVEHDPSMPASMLRTASGNFNTH